VPSIYYAHRRRVVRKTATCSPKPGEEGEEGLGPLPDGGRYQLHLPVCYCFDVDSLLKTIASRRGATHGRQTSDASMGSARKDISLAMGEIEQPCRRSWRVRFIT
jgi:hypothetical protein